MVKERERLVMFTDGQHEQDTFPEGQRKQFPSNDVA